MTAEMLIAAVLLAGAALLVLYVLHEGRRIEDLDPRAGQIVYEDVEKPGLPGVASVESPEVEPVPFLYYVDNDFEVPLDGSAARVSLVLRGKADRVVRKRDGALHVIDYKSGRSSRPEQDADEKLPDKAEYYKYQLMAYFLMLEQTYDERPSKAIIDFLDGGSADFTEIENTEQIREECQDLVRELCAVKLGAIPEPLLEAIEGERRERT
jgi:CRISPR/Cas system-associated exonuclease Cas4 (RecB family)